MTKRDFALIALAFRAVYDTAAPSERDVIRALANVLCPLFKADNVLFDQAGFMKVACGE